MANFVYTFAAHLMLQEELDFDVGTWRVMLCTATYRPVRDNGDIFVDEGVGDDAESGETTASNYVRKTITRPAATSPPTFSPSHYAYCKFDDPGTWTSLGNGVNETIKFVLLIREGASDTTSLQVVNIDTSTGSPSLPFLTNGSNLTISWDSSGVFRTAG